MLLVVFGAGASFDSVPHFRPPHIFPATRPPLELTHPENDRPPLANQLFDTRPSFVLAMTRFPACIPLIPRLRKTDIQVEQELAIIRDEAVDYPPAHREIASIRYYLHFALWECQQNWQRQHVGITNYATLLREIERWRYRHNEEVCLVTFNYDTMLDEELERLLNIKFAKLSDYAQKHYSLIKLHGSINWGREVINFDKHRDRNFHDLINAASGLQFGGNYWVVTEHPMYHNHSGGALLFPALSIPVVNKDEFSCPESHVQHLLEKLPKVNKILTIGWRATEANFLTMLRTELSVKHPGLMIVSGDDAGATETYNNLTGNSEAKQKEQFFNLPPGALTAGTWKKVTAGFTDLINNLDVLDAFLRYS